MNGGGPLSEWRGVHWVNVGGSMGEWRGGPLGEWRGSTG